MNNTLVAMIAGAGLWALDHIHASPWLAAPLALALGYYVARRITGRNYAG